MKYSICLFMLILIPTELQTVSHQVGRRTRQCRSLLIYAVQRIQISAIEQGFTQNSSAFSNVHYSFTVLAGQPVSPTGH